MRRLLAPWVALVCAAGVLSGGGAGAPLSLTSAPSSARAATDPCRTGEVALTFDDGPGPSTEPLLATLRGLDAPATFFMVGQRVARTPRLARRVERAGFLVANHSYAHAQMTAQSDAEVVGTLRSTGRALRRAGVHPTPLMRPPYGDLNARVRAAIRSAGLVPVLWTADSRDWAGGASSTIAASVLAQLHPHESNIVLMHDGVANSPATVAAVPSVVREARARGYCLVGLDERGRPGFPIPDARLITHAGVEGRAARITVLLDKPAGRDVSVRLRTRPGTARVGSDVARIRRTLVVPAGRLSVTLPVPLLRDGIDERAERFSVQLRHSHGLRLDRTQRSAEVVVRDADPTPRVSGGPVSIAEPAAGRDTVTVLLRLDRPSDRATSVFVATTAATAGPKDYLSLRRRVRFEAGQQRVVVPVTVYADSLVEPPERFVLRLSDARGLRVGASPGITITPPL